MAGFEVFGEEERRALNEIFEKANGVVFAHGFDAMRNGQFKVREFESNFAKIVGARYGQAVSSGSAALKVALQALGVGPGDEVITQAYTFVATVEAIFEVGATPIIVDVNDTLNMDPPKLEAAITPKTKIIVPVHMMGECAEMDEIMAIARKRNLLVMEDAAQAVGAKYKGKYSGTIANIGAYSTDAGKTVNTGEGGVIVTSDENLYLRSRALHDHGHEYSTSLGRGEERALLRGFNYRMSEMQGAVGCVQLTKLDMILERQRANKAALMKYIGQMPVKFRRSADPHGDTGDTIVFYMPDRESTTQFVAAMREKGLGTKNLPDAIRWHFSKHWTHMLSDHPLYSHKVATAWEPSADILECSVAIPVMVKMDDARIDFVGSTLVDIARKIL